MTANLPTLGMIGLGAMGGPIARNLLAAGYPVHAFDLNQDRLVEAKSAGAVAATTAHEVVRAGKIILTSLPSSDIFVALAEATMLPHLRAGQIVIDLGTTTPPETRRLAALFAAKEVELLDVPVSGGPGGVERRDLYMFAGGSEVVVRELWPLLTAIGGPDKITYCGPTGCGQVVKGVNQLMMGLVNAAYLEAMAFGVNGGVDATIVQQAIGSTGRWRKDFNSTAAQIVAGDGTQVGVKFRELPYFLREAVENQFELPLTERLYQFCDKGERVVIDDNRPAPSFWRELTLGQYA
jgi:3-hydroxyisobutyrate dehydrogenase-like beta-hydroxyacid dehydrogenase